MRLKYAGSTGVLDCRSLATYQLLENVRGPKFCFFCKLRLKHLMMSHSAIYELLLWAFRLHTHLSKLVFEKYPIYQNFLYPQENVSITEMIWICLGVDFLFYFQRFCRGFLLCCIWFIETVVLVLLITLNLFFSVVLQLLL